MLLLIKKSKRKIFFLKKGGGGGGGGGASEIRQTWGGACPKRLKTPAVDNKCLYPNYKLLSQYFCYLNVCNTEIMMCG